MALIGNGVVHYPYAETLPFAYPLTTTLFHLILACIILFFGGAFLNLSKPFSYHRLRSTTSTSLRLNEPRRSNAGNTKYVHSAGPTTDSHFTILSKTLPLAITFVAEIVLSNYVTYFAPLEVFLLSRAMVLLFALVYIQFFEQNDSRYSFASITISILLSVSIILATYVPDLPHSQRIIWAALLSAALGAAWPLQFQHVLQSFSSGTDNEQPEMGIETSNDLRNGRDFYGFTKLLCYICSISILLLLPVTLLSGELGYIWRNCYILRLPQFWFQLSLGGVYRWLLFVSTALLVRETSALNVTFLTVVVNASQGALLTSSKSFTPLQLLGFSGILLAALWFYWTDIVSALVNSGNSLWALPGRSSTLRRPPMLAVVGVSIIFCLSLLPGILKERHAASGGRYHSTVPMLQGNDAYLGRRPHLETVANITMLVEICTGTYEHKEHVRNIAQCMDFLANKQDQYLYLPGSLGKNSQSVSNNNYNTTDTAAEQTYELNCPGKIILYHIWWTGLPTQRIELFIKSYLYTQNLVCSNLWIWINSDRHPGAMQEWLNDARFARFQALVNNGKIVLHEWKLPPRIRLPTEIDELDKARYYKIPGKPDEYGWVSVADCIVRDPKGRDWLTIYEPGDGNQMTYFTIATSDAARLIILHLHGGVYLDVDMVLLRDMRPLLLSDTPFAERWGTNPDSSLYNNAVVHLPAYSPLSSYMLYGGTRIGRVYHFMVLGRMMALEGRDSSSDKGLRKLEAAFFDPIWMEARDGKCVVPCLNSQGDVFTAAPVPGEWQAFEGPPLTGSDEGKGTNRTLENFYRGSWAYHIHNQVCFCQASRV